MRKPVNLPLLDVIGRGGQATIYKIIDDNGQTAAMKVYHANQNPSAEEQQTIARFKRLDDSTSLLVPRLETITLISGHKITVLLMP